MDKHKFTTGNFNNEVRSHQMISQVKWEAQREEQVSNGVILSEDVLAIKEACKNARLEELGKRKEAGDDSDDLPGIMRHYKLEPEHEFVMYAKVDVLLWMDLTKHMNGERANGVLQIDGTGNLCKILKGDASHDGKTQHVRMTVQLAETVLSKCDAKGHQVGDYGVICIAERVSESNRSSDIAAMIGMLHRDTVATGRKMYGPGYDSAIGLIHADGAVEIGSGALLALAKPGQVTTLQAYNAMVCAVILHYEHETLDISTPAVHEVAAQAAVELIQEKSPTMIAQCNVHACLAQHDGRKHMKNKPPELKGYPDQFDLVFSHLANHLRKEKLLSRVIARLCVVVSIFDREELACSNFDIDSAVREHHDKSQSAAIALEMNKFIRRVQTNMLIETEDEMKRAVEHQLKKIHSQHFNGMEFANNAVEMLKNELQVAAPYLQSINKKERTGVIKVPIVYSCYKLNEEDGNLEVTARVVGGFKGVNVSLPFTAGKIPNPLYSKRAAKYWKKWGDISPLWALPIIELTRSAWNRGIIYGNTMSIESYQKEGKCFTGNVRAIHSHTTSLINDRMNRSMVEAMMAVKNYRAYPLKRELRLKRKEKKENAVKAENKSAIKKEEEGMQWSRGKGKMGSKSRLESQVKMIMRALEVGRENGEFNYDDGNRESMRRVIADFGERMDEPLDFMKRSAFNDVMNGNRKKALKPKDTKIIEAFYELHVGNISG